MRLALGLLLGVASCVRSDVVRCGDELVCPTGTVCATVTPTPAAPEPALCVQQVQLDQCADKGANDPCEVDGVTNDATGPDGRCYDGVCLPAGCGNGRIDHQAGEVCDDGNAIVGDGCSANCLSDETCGNGVVDPIVAGAAGEQCDDGNLFSYDGCTTTCTNESPRWSRLRTGKPPARGGHAMAYGLRRGRVLMFGGRNDGRGGPLGDTWEWDGQAWIDRSPVFAPPPREHASITYDVRRDRIVMFGGLADVDATLAFDETWEWDGTRWEVAALATAPPARYNAGLTYDAKRGVSVLHGGTQPGIFPPRLDATWEWDGTTWTEITGLATSPGSQGDATMAFDPVRGVSVLVGLDGAGTSMAVWEYDGTWTQRSPALMPPSRRRPSLTFDPRLGKLILFGGQSQTLPTAGQVLDDSWSWDGTTWVELLGVKPKARTDHAAALDTARNTIVLFGGVDPGTQPALAYDDTLVWETDHGWRELDLRTPARRSDHAAAHDAKRGRAVMFGPGPGSTWELSTSWSPYTGQAPAPRRGSAMAYDAARGQVVMFGGSTLAATSDETWTFDGVAWTLATPPTKPAPRLSVAMAYDARRREVVMFGGDALGVSLPAGDTWIWNGTTWTERVLAAPPPGRSAHALAYDPIRERVVMFGGWGASGALSDTWEWDGVTWTERSPAVRPLARREAAMSWNPARRRVTLFGGGSNSMLTALNDAWEWDGTAWTRIDVDQAPSPRRAMFMVPAADGLGVITFGGVGADAAAGDNDEVWTLQWASSTTTTDTCRGDFDGDGDQLLGCADPGCWAVCTPTCSPGVSCGADEPRCGDGHCDPLETCRSCERDCDPCTPLCGDAVCDPGETCPGDCP